MARGQTNSVARRRIGRVWIIAGALVLVAALGSALAVASFRGSAKFHVRFKDIAGLQTGKPPWNNGAPGLADQLPALHLDALSGGSPAFHMSEHLDAYVDGTHVVVPAGIGVEPGSFATGLHTEKANGVIRVEAAKQPAYQLGQFFGEWGVRLNARCIATDCSPLTWWVNGKRQTGNPAELVLRPHQEIVIASGTPPVKIPGHYDFSAGE